MKINVSIKILLAAILTASAFSGAYSRPSLIYNSAYHSGPVFRILPLANGRQVATAGYDNTIRIWDASTLKPVNKLFLGGGETKKVNLNAIAYSDKNDLMAFAVLSETPALKQGEIYTYKPLGKEKPVRLGIHGETITAMEFSPDGRFLVSVSADKVAKIWELETREGVELPYKSFTFIKDLAFSPDGSTLVLMEKSNTLRIVDFAKREANNLIFHGEEELTGVVFSKDGRNIFSADLNGGIKAWNSGTLKPTGSFQIPKGFAYDILPVNGDLLAVTTATTSFENSVIVYDYKTGRQVARQSFQTVGFIAGAVSKSGDKLFFAENQSKILYSADILMRKPFRQTGGLGMTVRNLGFSEDSKKIFLSRFASPKLIFSGGNNYEFEVNLIEDEERIFLPSEAGPVKQPVEIPFQNSAGGFEIATYNNFISTILKIRDAEGGVRNIKRSYEDGFLHQSIAISPVGDLIASGGGMGELFVYDSVEPEKKEKLQGHTGDVLAVSFSRDGKYLLSAGADDLVILWSLETKKPIMNFYRVKEEGWVFWYPDQVFSLQGQPDPYLAWVGNGSDLFVNKLLPFSVFKGRLSISSNDPWEPMDLSDSYSLFPSRREQILYDDFACAVSRMINSSENPIKKVSIQLNGSTLVEPQTPSWENGKYYIDRCLTLAQGQNVLTYLLERDYGEPERDTYTLYYNRPPSENFLLPNLNVVLVSGKPAKGSERRIKDIEARLLGLANSTVKNTNLLKIRYPETNAENFRQGLKWILKNTSPKDISLIYVSGGSFDANSERFLFDTAGESETQIRNIAAPMTEVLETLGYYKNNVFVWENISAEDSSGIKNFFSGKYPEYHGKESGSGKAFFCCTKEEGASMNRLEAYENILERLEYN